MRFTWDNVARLQRQVSEAADAVQAVHTNEGITRVRVSKVEEVIGRNLWGRFRWLLLGK